MSKSYMSGTEYRKALRELGLPTHETAAKFLRVATSTTARRSTERMAVTWDTATLLRLMVTLKLTPERLVELLGKD